jgi:GNAT superfamily N-acetyltransferase
MDAIEYHIATTSEIPQLAQMRWDFREEDDTEPHVMTYAEFIESCTAFLIQGMYSGQWVYWVATQQERVVSHIFIFRIQSVPRPCKQADYWGYMTNVYTTPAFRQHGIGSTLMNHAMQWARTQGLALIMVSPSDTAIPFYQRAGFTCETEFMQYTFSQKE